VAPRFATDHAAPPEPRRVGRIVGLRRGQHRLALIQINVAAAQAWYFEGIVAVLTPMYRAQAEKEPQAIDRAVDSCCGTQGEPA
jgi:hypothetical protein